MSSNLAVSFFWLFVFCPERTDLKRSLAGSDTAPA